MGGQLDTVERSFSCGTEGRWAEIQKLSVQPEVGIYGPDNGSWRHDDDDECLSQ